MKKTVLVIDDDRNIVEFLHQLLTQNNYEVISAYDGNNGLEIFQAQKPDLVILDLNLPGQNGLQICKKIKSDKSTKFTPVVVITVRDDFDSKIKCIDYGVDDFLNKPFNSIELLTRIKSLIRTKSLYEQLEEQENVIFALTKTIEAKDPYTQGHAARVSFLSQKVANKLGASENDIELVRIGGILHDIGKIAVPDYILKKPAPLTKGEREIVKIHPIEGEKICKELKSLKDILPLVRWHHEKLDGSGYPDNLKDKKIPYLVRIMSVCDIYEALTSHRAYRKAMSVDEALNILEQETNIGWWDRDVVNALKSIAKKGEI